MAGQDGEEKPVVASRFGTMHIGLKIQGLIRKAMEHPDNPH